MKPSYGVVLAALVLLVFGVIAYRLIDRAMFVNDMQVGLASREEDLDVALRLFPILHREAHRLEVDRSIREQFSGTLDVIKWEGDTLWVNGLGLAFAGDTVNSIVLLNPLD